MVTSIIDARNYITQAQIQEGEIREMGIRVSQSTTISRTLKKSKYTRKRAYQLFRSREIRQLSSKKEKFMHSRYNYKLMKIFGFSMSADLIDTHQLTMDTHYKTQKQLNSQVGIKVKTLVYYALSQTEELLQN